MCVFFLLVETMNGNRITILPIDNVNATLCCRYDLYLDEIELHFSVCSFIDLLDFISNQIICCNCIRCAFSIANGMA